MVEPFTDSRYPLSQLRHSGDAPDPAATRELVGIR